jgi:hypothetical protein
MISALVREGVGRVGGEVHLVVGRVYGVVNAGDGRGIRCRGKAEADQYILRRLLCEALVGLLKLFAEIVTAQWGSYVH